MSRSSFGRGKVFRAASIVLMLVVAVAHHCCASKVSFDPNGIAQVDGQPFFPIGVFTYEVNSEVLAELHELQANTILNGFATNQLDLIEQHGLKAVCCAEAPWVKAATNHPALLAWYLADEPEGRLKPEELQKRYKELKVSDPDHPIGLCHTSFEALTQFKGACDFTMTDIYPISAKRDQNIMGVSIMTDEARRIHGPNWPAWTYIQSFGGPETDHGVWAVPLPHEIRFMVYQALVHRSTGILYFSYWPRQQRMWQSIAPLNREIHQLIPRLVAPGTEGKCTASTPQIQTRLRTMGNSSKSGLFIAINTTPKFVASELKAENVPSELKLPFENRSVVTKDGRWKQRFGPYEAHVYVWGEES